MDTLLSMRERVEQKLFADLLAAQEDYRHCVDDQKAEAQERYKRALGRFDQLILWNRLPID